MQVVQTVCLASPSTKHLACTDHGLMVVQTAHGGGGGGGVRKYVGWKYFAGYVCGLEGEAHREWYSPATVISRVGTRGPIESAPP